MNKERLKSYVLGNKEHLAVEGWVDEGAISAVVAIATLQERRGAHGDVAEIGVHHGRFFILLANLRRADEWAFAVDVFADQHLNTDHSGSGDLRRFGDNLGRMTDNQRIEIIQKDSKNLLLTDFDASPRHQIRLFSIDGSHTAEHTFSDLRIASALLAPEGLIILDDFYNPDWPGVQEGLHWFLRELSVGITPFAFGNNKLYLCQKAVHDDYLDLVETDIKPYLTHYKRVELGGCAAAHIELPSPEMVFSEQLDLLPNVYSLRGDTFSVCVELQNGWCVPERSGVWTYGPVAELRLHSTSLPRGGGAMRLVVEPFLHRDRRTRGLGVAVNGVDLGLFKVGGTAPHVVEAQLPPDCLGADNLFRFTIEAPEAPAKTIGTADQRPLGFRLREIRIAESKSA